MSRKKIKKKLIATENPIVDMQANVQKLQLKSPEVSDKQEKNIFDGRNKSNETKSSMIPPLPEARIRNSEQQSQLPELRVSR